MPDSPDSDLPQPPASGPDSHRTAPGNPGSAPAPANGAFPSDADRRYQAALEEELEAARRKRDTYQALLKELPEVFEGKFRERIRPVQQRNEQLIGEGQALREQIRRALPPPPGAPPAAIAPSPAAPEPAPRRAPGAWPGRSPGLDPRPGTGIPWPLTGGNLAAGAIGAGGAVLLLLGALTLLPRLAPLALGPAAGPSGPRGAGAAAVAAVPQGWLRLRTTGPSWIEVRDADNRVLFTDQLNGQKLFPLGRGLRLRSGRADLVRIRIGNQPERSLGPVSMVDWRRFSPEPAPPP